MGHHRPASETPLKWHFAAGPMMAQHIMLADFSGDPDQYCKETLYFCDFPGGGGGGSGPPSKSQYWSLRRILQIQTLDPPMLRILICAFVVRLHHTQVFP